MALSAAATNILSFLNAQGKQPKHKIIKGANVTGAEFDSAVTELINGGFIVNLYSCVFKAL